MTELGELSEQFFYWLSLLHPDPSGVYLGNFAGLGWALLVGAG